MTSRDHRAAQRALAERATEATQPAIRLAGVNKAYGIGDASLLALHDVNLDIRGGEFVAVVGPSGCGKSTMLRVVAGLIPPGSGEVWIGGSRVRGTRRDIGIVFQSPVLFPWRTVLENVLLPIDVQELHRRDNLAKARELLALVGLRDFETRYPAELSGGMQQRVGIARALVHDPSILLMDEPLSALDSQTRELLMEDFVRLLADGAMGAVYVTHNLDEAVRLADRIVVLSRRPGRIREIVSIPMTRAERGTVDARGRMAALQGELWSLIRKEAIDAEREVQHA